MKRYFIILITLCGVATLSASAQVSKQVEVTKNYAPEIGKARKMEITPNMIDTATIRPDIDYSIVKQPFALTLGTRSFDPATITYWEYQRRYPFYLKLGAGYPLNTEGDFYASSYRAGVGYIAGYANHEGYYSKLRYTNGLDKKLYKDNRSMQMSNRFGVMGGKYFGRYTLAGDLSYAMDIYHRYPFHNEYAEDGTPVLVYKRRRIDFGDTKLSVSFGDSFADLNHLNFKAYASVDYFHDKSENYVAGDRYQQMNVAAGLALARNFGKYSSLSLDVDYEGYYGLYSLRNYDNSMLGAAVLYKYRSGGMVDLNVGAKVVYDNNPADAKPNRWHAFPNVRLSLNIGDSGLAVPYVEVDGDVQNNSYYSLLKQNPYIAILGGGNSVLQVDKATPNTESYNVRFGVSGHLANNKLAYRGYVSMSFMMNALYWYNVNQIFFDAVTARRNVWSLCAAVDYRPISQLLLTGQVKGTLYSNFATLGDTHLEGALPNVEVMLRALYTHEKFTLGLSAELYGPTKWTWVQNDALFNPDSTTPVRVGKFTAPTSLDLSLYADWHVSKTCTVYAEGGNLLGDVLPTYRWAFYREVGASFTVGVKLKF